MNKSQLKGAAKEAAGKVQAAGGRAVGSTAQEAKGMARQAAGKAQRAMGDAKESVKRKSSKPA